MSAEKIGIGEKLGAKLTTVDKKQCECQYWNDGCVYHPEDNTFICRQCGGVILPSQKKSSSR